MPTKKQNTKPKTKRSSRWLDHVKGHYAKSKGKKTWKQCLSDCKGTYKRVSTGEKNITSKHNAPSVQQQPSEQPNNNNTE